MKKVLLHIILVSYAIAMFKPVFPYVEDFIGHVMFYKQHMATIHLENGKYHVHAEVVKNVKEVDSKKSPSSSKKQPTTNDHIVVVNKEAITFTASTVHTYSLPTCNDLLTGNLSDNYPPPRI